MTRAKTVTLRPGDRYGRLTIIAEERLPNTPGRARHGFQNGPLGARCRCDCGNELLVATNALTSGNTRSCGCLRTEIATARLPSMTAANRSHGLTRHPLYGTWRGMMMRCYDHGHIFYESYGGRGIRVCKQWHDVVAFIREIEVLLGPRLPESTLDRIDNDGNYEPGNVRWATQSQQMRNRRPREPLFTADQVAAMRAQRAAGKPLREIAEQRGYSIATVWKYTKN